MKDKSINKELVDHLIIDPAKKFINDSSTSGILLFSSAFIAIVLSNSPLADSFDQLWLYKFSIGFDTFSVSKDLHHWINDGLMAVFFFVVGLELKGEIIGGELRNFKSAILPLVAAIGGMIFPAMIYLAINNEGHASNGWGIPMATDIAFSLGVLYLVGDRVPLSLKVFLTALAIADDIGAVIVIALFYSSDISLVSLAYGFGFLIVMLIANVIGVRSTIFYAVVGIGGLWLAFLASGVHATIAAVLAAFTIPSKAKVNEAYFGDYMEKLVSRFRQADPNDVKTLTKKQLHILQEMRTYSKKALTPLQRLEDNMHPFVAFIIMPIFALSNAGVAFSTDFFSQLLNPVVLGIVAGLLIGKVIGVVGFVTFTTSFTSIKLPDGMNKLHLWGAGFLAAVGFTMSLFISGLAFLQQDIIDQAKLGVLVASLIASVVGYLFIKKACQVDSTKSE